MSGGGAYTVQVHRSLDDLDWASLAAGAPAEHDLPYVAWAGTVAPDRQRYLSAHAPDGSLVGAVAGRVTGETSSFFVDPAAIVTSPQMLREPAEGESAAGAEELAARRRRLVGALYPCLVFSSLASTHVLVHPDHTGRAEEVVAALARAAAGHADADWRSVAWLYVRADDEPLRAALGAAGCVAGTWSAVGVVPELCAAGDFDGYLARLTRKARGNVRRERRRFADSGLAARELDTAAWLPEIARLELLNAEKHDSVEAVERIIRSHDGLVAALGDRLRAHGAFAGDELVASVMGMVGADGTWTVLGYGSDDERTVGTYTYAELVFCRSIEAALAAGCDRISFGIEGHGAKALRGARLEPRELWWDVPVAERAEVADWLAVLDRRNRAHLEAHAPATA